MRWALVPHYYKGTLAEFKPILNNCRAETIDEKPTFKAPLKNGQRCVILAEGFVRSIVPALLDHLDRPSLRFYEWKKNVTKTPYFIYQTEPLLNEKHYPDINVEQVRQKLDEAHPGQLPLLAMAGLFEVNRFCEVGRSLECISIDRVPLLDRSFVFMHDLHGRRQ